MKNTPTFTKKFFVYFFVVSSFKVNYLPMIRICDTGRHHGTTRPVMFPTVSVPLVPGKFLRRLDQYVYSVHVRWSSLDIST